MGGVGLSLLAKGEDSYCFFLKLGLICLYIKLEIYEKLS